MKQFLFYTFLFSLVWSCSTQDDDLSVHQELLPIEQAFLPEECQLSEGCEVTLTYLKPTNCYDFYNIFYSKEGNERIVAVITTVYSNTNCNTINSEEETSFDFTPREAGVYIFKFWQGENENNEDEYITYEIEVLE